MFGLEERVIRLEQERAKLVFEKKEEQALRALQSERLKKKTRAFKSLPPVSPQMRPAESPSAGSSGPITSPSPQTPQSEPASAETSVPKRAAPPMVPNEVGGMQKESRQAQLKGKIQQFANIPESLKSTESQASVPDVDLAEVLPSAVQRDEVLDVEVQESKGPEAEVLKVEGQGSEIPAGEVTESTVLDDEIQESKGQASEGLKAKAQSEEISDEQVPEIEIPAGEMQEKEGQKDEVLKAEVPGDVSSSVEFPESGVPALVSPTGERRQDADLGQQLTQSSNLSDEEQKDDVATSSEAMGGVNATKGQKSDEGRHVPTSELDDLSFDQIALEQKSEMKEEDKEMGQPPSVQEQFSNAKIKGIRYRFVQEVSGEKGSVINLEEFAESWKNLRLVIESNVPGHLYVLTSYAKNKWQWVKPLYVRKPSEPGGGITMEPFQSIEFSLGQLTNSLGKPMVSSIRVALSSQPLPNLNDVFGTKEAGKQRDSQVVDRQNNQVYVVKKSVETQGPLVIEIPLE